MSESFDYIVVGSGSSGAVVAARLSENPGLKILLLEAGPPNRTLWSDIPLGFGKIVTNPLYRWAAAAEPAAALRGRRLALLGGRIAGGSSALNGMVYVRGFPQDYALWRQMGATGWSYEDVLPYFRKAERHRAGPSAYHGGDGPVGVEGPRWRNPLAEAFLQSAEATGLPRLHDFAGPKVEGVGYHDLTSWNGRRASTWRGYLAPNRRRANLCLRTNATACRLIFEGHRATGILYEQGGQQRTAHAAAEIILSAGALQTPRLLQLSGIGPAALLAAHGIPLLRDLPGVGENLMDHLHVTLGYRTTSRCTINATMQSKPALLAAGLAYALRGAGPLTIGAAFAGGFAKTRPQHEIPDIQIGFSPVLPDHATPGALAPFSGFLLSTYQLRPESRGHVRIASSNPRAPASIALNPLSTANDRQVLLEGLKLLRRIGRGQPLRQRGATPLSPGLTGDTEDEAALMAHAETAAGSAFHYSGTARIGTDARAVVDPSLRVHGIDRLRVIDASVMPTVTSGNTNAACIMIGEKGADLLKAN